MAQIIMDSATAAAVETPTRGEVTLLIGTYKMDSYSGWSYGDLDHYWTRYLCGGEIKTLHDQGVTV